MTDPDAPYHAHIYYDPAERPAAAALRDALAGDPAILLVGPMTDRPIGPHPCPQYEVHFRACSVETIRGHVRLAVGDPLHARATIRGDTAEGEILPRHFGALARPAPTVGSPPRRPGPTG